MSGPAGGVAGGDVQTARMAQAVAQVVSMKYGREDELESDKWGVKLIQWFEFDLCFIASQRLKDNLIRKGLLHNKGFHSLQYIVSHSHCFIS